VVLLQIYLSQQQGGKFRANSVNGRTAAAYLRAAPEFFTDEIWGKAVAKNAREGWRLLAKLQFLIEGKAEDGESNYPKGWFAAAAEFDACAKPCLTALHKAWPALHFPVYVHILLGHGGQLLRHVRAHLACRSLFYF
jgi:hypothetical protein